MSRLLKKYIALFLVFMLISTPVFARGDKLMFDTGIQHEFSPSAIPDEVLFKTSEEIKINEEITIPANSTILFETLEAQTERRWHKSGYILVKVKGYFKEASEDFIDLNEKNIYLIGRKYIPVDKKDAAILTTEIIVTQAASIVGSVFIFFAPVDIAYFFVKGAIQREKHPNWFKAGFFNAYDNSIMWFWFKGRPIELAENDTVRFKEIKEKKALKLQTKIQNRKAKQAVKYQKKLAKIQAKEIKNLPKGRIFEAIQEELYTHTVYDEVKHQTFIEPPEILL